MKNAKPGVPTVPLLQSHIEALKARVSALEDALHDMDERYTMLCREIDKVVDEAVEEILAQCD